MDDNIFATFFFILAASSGLFILFEAFTREDCRRRSRSAKSSQQLTAVNNFAVPPPTLKYPAAQSLLQTGGKLATYLPAGTQPNDQGWGIDGYNVPNDGYGEAGVGDNGEPFWKQDQTTDDDFTERVGRSCDWPTMGDLPDPDQDMRFTSKVPESTDIPVFRLKRSSDSEVKRTDNPYQNAILGARSLNKLRCSGKVNNEMSRGGKTGDNMVNPKSEVNSDEWNKQKYSGTYQQNYVCGRIDKCIPYAVVNNVKEAKRIEDDRKNQNGSRNFDEDETQLEDEISGQTGLKLYILPKGDPYAETYKEEVTTRASKAKEIMRKAEYMECCKDLGLKRIRGK